MKHVPLMFSLCFLFSLSCGGVGTPGKGNGDTGDDVQQTIEFGGVEISPASFDFGNVEVGESATETWTVDNESADAVTISNAFVEGTGFDVDSDVSFPADLASGESASGSVLFEPPATGPFSGRLKIGIAGEVGYAELVLRGQGVEPGTTDDTGGPSSSGTLIAFPENLGFGPIAIGETSWRTLQLTNTGDGPVLITRLTSSNTFVFQAEPDFSVPLSLSAGQTQTVQMSFSPFELREYTAVLDIDADVVDGGIMVPLSGTGSESSCTICAPVLSVYTSSGSADTLSLSPPSGMGCTANGSVTLTNTGDLPLTISDVTLNNDAISTCGEFSLSWLGSTSLEPGTSTTVGIDFVATSICMESAYPETDQNVLHVLSTDPDTPDYTVNLEGTALYCGG